MRLGWAFPQALPRGGGQITPPHTEEQEGTDRLQPQVLVASSPPREGHDSTADEGLYEVGDGRENGFPPPQGRCSGPLKRYSDSSRFRNFDFSFLSLYLSKDFYCQRRSGYKRKENTSHQVLAHWPDPPPTTNHQRTAAESCQIGLETLVPVRLNPTVREKTARNQVSQPEKPERVSHRIPWE